MLCACAKAHPCGGYEWRVVRLGADIGLECLTLRPPDYAGTGVPLKNRLKKIVCKAVKMTRKTAEKPHILFLFSDTGGWGPSQRRQGDH